eukprot:g1890.t1
MLRKLGDAHEELVATKRHAKARVDFIKESIRLVKKSPTRLCGVCAQLPSVVALASNLEDGHSSSCVACGDRLGDDEGKRLEAAAGAAAGGAIYDGRRYGEKKAHSNIPRGYLRSCEMVIREDHSGQQQRTAALEAMNKILRERVRVLEDGKSAWAESANAAADHADVDVEMVDNAFRRRLEDEIHDLKLRLRNKCGEMKAAEAQLRVAQQYGDEARAATNAAVTEANQLRSQLQRAEATQVQRQHDFTRLEREKAATDTQFVALRAQLHEVLKQNAALQKEKEDLQNDKEDLKSYVRKVQSWHPQQQMQAWMPPHMQQAHLLQMQQPRLVDNFIQRLQEDLQTALNHLGKTYDEEVADYLSGIEKLQTAAQEITQDIVSLKADLVKAVNANKDFLEKQKADDLRVSCQKEDQLRAQIVEQERLRARVGGDEINGAAGGGAAGGASRADLAGDYCVICMERPKQVIIFPCGHKKLCSTCAERFGPGKPGQHGKCPICRTAIQGTLDQVFE